MRKLVLVGAGKVCELFCKDEENGLISLFSEVYLFDNDENKQNKDLYGYHVLTPESFCSILKDDNVCVIITANNWREIIKDDKLSLHLNKLRAIYTFNTYDNLKSIEYNDNLFFLQQNGCKRFLDGEPLFNCINRVAIMLSNLCNYSCFHKACPACNVREKEIMPSKTVYMVIDELCENNFVGEVCFHLYNEPLMDPRLFSFIQYAKSKMPNINIHVYTNGYYLNETMVSELEICGVTRITSTAYSEKEWKRLTSLKPNVAFHVLKGNLDQRLALYNNNEGVVCNSKCISYFEQIPIYVNGDIGTCCLDWQHKYNLGNINNSSLKEIINSKVIADFQNALLQGDRSVFPICRNCDWH